MSAVAVLLVFAGGALGAPSRYLCDRFVQARHTWRFPLGTLLINVLGCFVLGVVTGADDLSPHLVAVLGAGFCGGFTTFSTFSVEAVDLAEQRLPLRAVAYVAVSVVLGVAAARAGCAVADSF